MAKKKTTDLPKLPWGQGSFFYHTNSIGYRKYHKYPSGKKELKTVYGDTIDECLEKMKILERQLDEEIIVSKDILYDAMFKWLENVKKSRLKPQSYFRYEYVIENQIKPSLIGHSQYQKITSQEIQKFINALNEDENLSYSTIQKCFNLLKSFYKYECAINGIKDPMTVVVLPIKYNIKKAEKEIAWFDEDDIRKFIREATRINNKTKNYVYPNGHIIAANIFLGLRIGELLALQWKDVDLKKGKIYITKTTTQVKNPNYNPNDKNSIKNLIVIQDTTKTEVKRAVYINKQAKELILKHLELHPYESEDDYIICSRNKHLLSRTNINQTIKTIQKRGKTTVQGAASHTLRHTCASLLFKKGIQVEIIAKMLGHTPTTCRNIYIGVFDELIQEASEKINLDIDFEI